MSLVTLQEARVRLEGDLEVLEAATERYRTALAAAKGRGWREKISALGESLEVAASLEARVDGALGHLQRRAEMDGWTSRSPALLLASKLRLLRRDLSRKLASRVELTGANLGEQLGACARLSMLRARDLAADARWEVVSLDNTLGISSAVMVACCCGVFGQLFGSVLGPFRFGLWAMGVPLLLVSIWRYRRWRNELRLYACESVIEAWKGHLPRLAHLWTVKLRAGDTLGIGAEAQSRGGKTYHLHVRQEASPERRLQTYPTLDAAREGRRQIVEMMGLKGSEREVPDRTGDEKEWLLDITEPTDRT